MKGGRTWHQDTQRGGWAWNPSEEERKASRAQEGAVLTGAGCRGQLPSTLGHHWSQSRAPSGQGAASFSEAAPLCFWPGSVRSAGRDRAPVFKFRANLKARDYRMKRACVCVCLSWGEGAYSGHKFTGARPCTTHRGQTSQKRRLFSLTPKESASKLTIWNV